MKKLLFSLIVLIGTQLNLAQAQDAEYHKPLDELLGKYVYEFSDEVNRVDYGAWKSSAADSAQLDSYISSFETLDFGALSRDEQFAAWANLYNAVTVQHILSRYPLDSIRDGYWVGPWKKVKVKAGGRTVSLDAIENDILRPQFDDPRVHYAINCASYGCPNLRKTAWVASTLDEDLNAAARAYINHPRGVTLRKKGSLQVSTIYKWFKEDFGGNEAGIVDHLLEYAEPDLAAQIRAKPKITKYAYDWDLNDRK